MWSVVAIISLAVVVFGALGVVSCLVSHQRPVPGGMGGEPPHSTLPMLALHSGMERLRLEAGVGAGRPERQSSHAHAHSHSHAHSRRAVDCAVDRAVRLTAVSTDLQLDLPPSIALPDGEEYPYGSSARLHIRDPEQESEIYQKCIRPPPNRTVFDGESPPPYRSNSASSGSGAPSILRHTHRYPHHHHSQPLGYHPPGYPQGQPQAGHLHGPVGPQAAGHGLPAVIVPSPPRTAPFPGLLLAAPTGKHSTHPSGPAAPSHGPGAPPSASSTAAGLARLLSPSTARDPPRPKVTVDSRTAPSAQSAELVNVNSDACEPTVRDIPGAALPSGSSHLDALTMVPCLTDSSARTEPRGPLEGPGRPAPPPCGPSSRPDRSARSTDRPV